MKKIIAILAALAAITISFAGEPLNVREFLREDPLRYSSNQHNYEVLDSTVTPAPKGYNAFYISHLSRHGSRAHGSKNEFRGLDTMLVYRSKGLLTPAADTLIALMESVRAANLAIGYGTLSDRGAWEHREIARRMGAHYPEVFTSGGSVTAYSTSVPRVIASMENFTQSLGAAYPELQISKLTTKDSKRAKLETNCAKFTKEQEKELDAVHTQHFRDSLLTLVDWTDQVNRYFKNGVVPRKYRGREGNLFYNIYKVGMNRQSFLDPSMGWIEPLFSDEQRYAIYNHRVTAQVFDWAYCDENKGYKLKAAGQILRSMIEDADEAIKGGADCATLRFSHDGQIMPVMCLMGLPGATFRGPLAEAYKHVCIPYTVHMAGNVQMVFYRNSRGKVLVKVLLNEEEVELPGLKADKKGVFYDWERLKAYFNSNME